MSEMSLKNELVAMLEEYQEQARLGENNIFVIGCSTSEVLGSKIGTGGALEVAQELFDAFSEIASKYRWNLAFQGCEHINRSLVINKEVARNRNFEEVSVVPVYEAGGSMATYAYRHLPNATVVEFIKADGGIDIGNTFIGMHLRHVAVPIRISKRKLQKASVTFAKTRPKLIGGERAKYL